MSNNETKVVTVSRLIPASPAAIFELLADPGRHADFDGSDMVQSSRSFKSDRLELGSKFVMSMKLGRLPYVISNKVVEFEDNRVIAWRHFARHVWRYQLEASPEGTLVTESFSWGDALFPPMYPWLGYPEAHAQNMTKTLERLAEAVLD